MVGTPSLREVGKSAMRSSAVAGVKPSASRARPGTQRPAQPSSSVGGAVFARHELPVPRPAVRAARARARQQVAALATAATLRGRNRGAPPGPGQRGLDRGAAAPVPTCVAVTELRAPAGAPRLGRGGRPDPSSWEQGCGAGLGAGRGRVRRRERGPRRSRAQGPLRGHLRYPLCVPALETASKQSRGLTRSPVLHAGPRPCGACPL